MVVGEESDVVEVAVAVVGDTSASDEQVRGNYFFCESDFSNNSYKNKGDDTNNIKAAVAA